MPMQEMQERRVQSLGWEDPLEEGMATPSPVLLPGESHGQRSLVGYSPWGCKVGCDLAIEGACAEYVVFSVCQHYS